jgi:hypothetical protein
MLYCKLNTDNFIGLFAYELENMQFRLALSFNSIRFYIKDNEYFVVFFDDVDRIISIKLLSDDYVEKCRKHIKDLNDNKTVADTLSSFDKMNGYDGKFKEEDGNNDITYVKNIKTEQENVENTFKQLKQNIEHEQNIKNIYSNNVGEAETGGRLDTN